mmetsp:Transcript_10017/g.24636  ORF Transcript_10017/g.24636 Transcript_10017/m.24636 type:complete len:324 (+) Transcript_10017:1419-2390(+)
MKVQKIQAVPSHHLAPTLRPSLLLLGVRRKSARELRHHHRVREEARVEPGAVGPQGEVGALQQRRSVPPACRGDGSRVPCGPRPRRHYTSHSARQCPARHRTMDLKAQRLRHRQHSVVVVEEAPAGLHHGEVWEHLATSGIEVRYHALEIIRRRDAVCVEHGKKVRRGFLAASLEGTGLVSPAMRPAHDVANQAALAPRGRRGVDDGAAFLVGGVVQHLNLQQVAGPPKQTGGIDGPAHQRSLVEHRQLNAHVGELLRQGGARGCTAVGLAEMKPRVSAADTAAIVVVVALVVVAGSAANSRHPPRRDGGVFESSESRVHPQP